MRGIKANDRRSPLPRRTGHGDFPPPALAKADSARMHSQRLQSQVVQMCRQADALAGAPAPLTASTQMLRSGMVDVFAMKLTVVPEPLTAAAACGLACSGSLSSGL